MLQVINAYLTYVKLTIAFNSNLRT